MNARLIAPGIALALFIVVSSAAFSVGEAQQVIVIKRSLSPGFAGIDNDLFYMEKTGMVFADAKKAAQDIAAEVTRL